jgi:hypothetical protein
MAIHELPLLTYLFKRGCPSDQSLQDGEQRLNDKHYRNDDLICRSVVV